MVLQNDLLVELLGFTVQHCKRLSDAGKHTELESCKNRAIRILNIFKRLDLVFTVVFPAAEYDPIVKNIENLGRLLKNRVLLVLCAFVAAIRADTQSTTTTAAPDGYHYHFPIFYHSAPVRAICSNSTGKLLPTATSCEDTAPAAFCQKFKKVGADDASRDPLCANPELKSFVDGCAKTCGTCCQNPVFSCENTKGIDCEKFRYKCTLTDKESQQFSKQFCPATCGLCNVAETSDSELNSCKDHPNANCAIMKPFCDDVNFQYILGTSCPVTCGTCGKQKTSECVDTNPRCAEWNANHFCSRSQWSTATKARLCKRPNDWLATRGHRRSIFSARASVTLVVRSFDDFAVNRCEHQLTDSWSSLMVASLLTISLNEFRLNADFNREILPQEVRRILSRFAEDVELFEFAFRRLLPQRRLPSQYIAFDLRRCRLDVEGTVRNLNAVVKPSAYIALCALNLMEKDYRKSPRPRTLVLDFLMMPTIHKAVSYYATYLRKREFRVADPMDTLMLFASNGFDRLFELFYLLNHDTISPVTLLRRSIGKRRAQRIIERLVWKRQISLNESFWKNIDRKQIISELWRRPGIITASYHSPFLESVVRCLMSEVSEWHLERLDRWMSEYSQNRQEFHIYCRLRRLRSQCSSQ